MNTTDFGDRKSDRRILIFEVVAIAVLFAVAGFVEGIFGFHGGLARDPKFFLMLCVAALFQYFDSTSKRIESKLDALLDPALKSD